MIQIINIAMFIFRRSFLNFPIEISPSYSDEIKILFFSFKT